MAQCVLPCLQAAHPGSPESALLCLAAAGQPAFEDRAPALATRLLAGASLPSFFCGGLLIFEAALVTLSEDHLRRRFNTAFNHLIENYVVFRGVYPISETAGAAWLKILARKAHSGFCSFLLVSAPKVLPDPASATFPAVGECLPHIVSQVISHALYVDIAEKLLAMTWQLETAPPSLLLARLAMTIVGIRADKLPGEERKAFVMDWFRDWIEMVARGGDCYGLAELVCDACAAVLRVAGLTAMTPLLTGELLRSAPRFFPVFVGVAKFVRDRIAQTRLAGRVARLREEFAAAGKQMECRAHAAAMAMIFDGARTGVDLAGFAADCEESDRIIAGS
jgi:hypothetical protein